MRLNTGYVCIFGRSRICTDILGTDGSSDWFTVGFNYEVGLFLLVVSVIYFMTGYRYLPNLNENANSTAPFLLFFINLFNRIRLTVYIAKLLSLD